MVIAASLPVCAIAFGEQQSGHGGQPPVYQRHPSGGKQWDTKHHWRGRQFTQSFPPVSAGSFTRPYPYHLDFYRMKYGGSYAPYFGNLYGPPQVVTAPPYYGPYYGGGWGFESGDMPAVGFGGVTGGTMGVPNTTVYEEPVQSNQTTPSSATTNGESLPSPAR